MYLPDTIPVWMRTESGFDYEIKVNRRAETLALAWLALMGTCAADKPDVAWRRLSDASSEAKRLFVQKQRLKTDADILAKKIESAAAEVREREVDFEIFLSEIPPVKPSALDKIFFWRAIAAKNRAESAMESAAAPVKSARLVHEELREGAAELGDRIAAIEIGREKLEIEMPRLERAYVNSVALEFAGIAAARGWADASAYAEDWLGRDRRRPELEFLIGLAEFFRLELSGAPAALSLLAGDFSESRISGGGMADELSSLSLFLRGGSANADTLNSPLSSLAGLINLAIAAESPDFSAAKSNEPASLGSKSSGVKDAAGESFELAADIARAALGKRESAQPEIKSALDCALDAVYALSAHIHIYTNRYEEFLDRAERNGVVLTPAHGYALGTLAICHALSGRRIPGDLTAMLKSGRRTDFLWYTLALAGASASGMDFPAGGGGGLFTIPEKG